jgi:autotransporter-associated beta strand protein
MTLNGSGNVKIIGKAADLHIGSGVGTTAKLSLNDNSVFTVGQGNLTVGIDGGNGTLEMTGGSTFKHLNNNGGYYVLYLGLHAGSIGAVNMTGGTSTTAGPLLDMGAIGVIDCGSDTGSGSITMHDYSAIKIAGITIGDSGTGNVSMFNNSKMTVTNDLTAGYYHGTGSMTLNDSAQISGNTLTVGAYGTDFSVVVKDTALAAFTGNVDVGFNWGNSVDDIGTASLTVSGTGAGPHLTTNGAIILGADGSGGTLNQVGGKSVSALPVILGEGDYSDSVANQVGAHSYAILNLSGGTLTAPSLTTHSAVISTDAGDLGATRVHPVVATVNFDGGTLQASASSPNFIAIDNPAATLTLKVLAGGAKIDTQGFNDKITNALVSGVAGPATDGGLTKLGSGTLLLTAAPTYTGTTSIQGGTLQLATSGPVTLTTVTGSGTSTLSVCTGTTLTATSIQVGTLSIGGAPIVITAAAAAVPEPSTIILLVLAGIGVLFQAWRKTRA